MCGFINSVSKATHRQRGGHGFESRWTPDFLFCFFWFFFRLLLSNCFNWKIYCDDHSSLSNWLMVDSLLLLTIVILLLVNSRNVYQDKYKTGPRHFISAFLLFRHSILSPLTQKSISVTLNQFANYNNLRLLGMTVAPRRAGVTILVSTQLLLASRKKLASAKTSVIKQENRAYWMFCPYLGWLPFVTVLKQQLKTIKGIQWPNVSKYTRWFSLLIV